MGDALYERDGDRLLPTQYTAGPWSPELQHAGPPAAILARALTPAEDDGLVFGRLTFDILRPVPIAPLEVATEVLRPGRRVQQVAATLRLAGDGTVLMRATAWRVRSAPLDAGVAGEPAPSLPEPSAAFTFPWWTDEVAYHAALEWRLASGSIEQPGPACVWTRMRMPLVAGEAITPLQHLLVMADAASGVSWQLDWGEFTFPNLDLSMHLQRTPRGEWMAMDAVTRPGGESFAQATSVLYDLDGRVGTTAQTLVLAPR